MKLYIAFAERCYAEARPSYAVMRCLSVCVSLFVTFVDSVETSNHMVKCFTPFGRPVILVFPHQTAWQYSDGDAPNGGV